MCCRCDVFSAKLRHEEPVAMAMADIMRGKAGDELCNAWVELNV